MNKTYKSKSEISINVKVCGAHVHISFIPHTLGGSSFTTDNPQLQQAIEHHRHFGRRFALAKTEKVIDMEADTYGNECQETKQPQSVTFVSLNDAKEYCAQTFGVSRTQLRSRAQICEVAAANGINIIFE